MIELTHKILKLKTDLTVRRSILHKVRNYLIVLPDQPDLEKALVLLGILDRSGAWSKGCPDMSPTAPAVEGPLCVGASSPAGSSPIQERLHLEIAVQGSSLPTTLRASSRAWA